MTIVFAIITGVTVGAIFAGLKLPIPAPTNIAGVLGIVGIYVGFTIVQYLRG
jgi:XapX domain-containing protein